MTRDEVKKVLFILASAYPNTYKNMTDTEKKTQIDFYLEMFGEYESAVVVVALKNYIKKNQYPPTVAGLTQQINLLTEKDTDSEQWNLIANACRRAYYNSQEEFNKLPKECQIFVGSPEGLRELSQLEAKILNTVTRGQFTKSILEIREREAARKSIPPELLKQLTHNVKCLEEKRDVL